MISVRTYGRVAEIGPGVVGIDVPRVDGDPEPFRISVDLPSWVRAG